MTRVAAPGADELAGYATAPGTTVGSMDTAAALVTALQTGRIGIRDLALGVATPARQRP